MGSQKFWGKQRLGAADFLSGRPIHFQHVFRCGVELASQRYKWRTWDRVDEAGLEAGKDVVCLQRDGVIAEVLHEISLIGISSQGEDFHLLQPGMA